MAMKVFVVLLALAAVGVVTADDDKNSSCPLWHYRQSENQPCVCGQELHGAIICSGDQVYLRVDYAMTWDSKSNDTLVALSRYAYHQYSATHIYKRAYSLMPNDTTQLNALMCGYNNREGFLCEKCHPNYGPAATSPKCSKCGDHSMASAIALYLTVKILPIAILFLLIMTFRIDLTYGPMLGYIIFCQGHAITTKLVNAIYQTSVMELKGFGYIMKLSLYISAAWDLDFLQVTNTIQPYCISPKLGNIDLFLLNFITALLPLCLVILSYVLIELHAHGFRIVVYCWKPLHSCFVRVRRNWSASDSIIHSYASLLLLSIASLNYNAFEILRLTDVYNASGVVKKNVLVNSPSVNAYTSKYAYYCIIVVLVLFFLGVCPSFLLLLYPIRLFRKMLHRCCSQRLVVKLNVFVETFQGPFKDGCNGTRDFRIIPGVAGCTLLCIEVVLCIAHAVHLNKYITTICAVFLALCSVLCAYTHPCKSSISNRSLTFHLMWLAILSALMALWWQDLEMDSKVLRYLFVIVTPVPHVLLLIWILYKVGNKMVRLCPRYVDSFRFTMGKVKYRKHLICESTSLLPDRLLNSQDYRELT